MCAFLPLLLSPMHLNYDNCVTKIQYYPTRAHIPQPTFPEPSLTAENPRIVLLSPLYLSIFHSITAIQETLGSLLLYPFLVPQSNV